MCLPFSVMINFYVLYESSNEENFLDNFSINIPVKVFFDFVPLISRSFALLFIIIIMCVCVHMSTGIHRVRKSVAYGCWEPNLNPLQDYLVFLSAKLLFPAFILLCFLCNKNNHHTKDGTSYQHHILRLSGLTIS